MDPLLLVLLFLAIGVARVASRAGESQREGETPRDRERSRWQGLADTVGLTETVSPGGSIDALRGAYGPLAVLIERTGYAESLSSRVTVHGLSPSIALRAEGIGARAGVFQRDDLEIGDPEFDREFDVQGDAAVVHALLDSATRASARRLFSGRIVHSARARDVSMRVGLADGALTAAIADMRNDGREPHPSTIHAMLELAGRLREPDDLLARLAANASQDTLPGVRLRNLRTLAERSPESPLTVATLEKSARGDADGEVRLQSALLLGPRGRGGLEALALDAAVDDAVSARAIEALGDAPAERAAHFLEQARARRRVLTAAAAARALGVTGATGAENVLLATLEDGSVAVRLAAIEALARAGSAHAVLPLKAIEQNASGPLTRAARQSVAEIQARLTGANPGQLALAAGPDGQVSLADDTHGRVTLPEPTEPS